MSDFAAFKDLCLAQKRVAEWTPMENTGPGSPTAKKAQKAAAAQAEAASTSSSSSDAAHP